MSNDQNRIKLSKAILDMKFMKRTKERVEKEEERIEGQTMYRKEITEEMKRGGKYVIVEVGINTCENLRDGRMSFGGMNPDIERIMAEDKSRRQEKKEKAKETEISDIEMAKRYKSSENMSKKERSKKKFLKPVDSD